MDPRLHSFYNIKISFTIDAELGLTRILITSQVAENVELVCKSLQISLKQELILHQKIKRLFSFSKEVAFELVTNI